MLNNHADDDKRPMMTANTDDVEHGDGEEDDDDDGDGEHGDGGKHVDINII